MVLTHCHFNDRKMAPSHGRKMVVRSEFLDLKTLSVQEENQDALILVARQEAGDEP